MFLIDAIKPKVEKKFKTCKKFFARLFRGGESEAFKIKLGLFLFALGLLVATKLYSKTKETRKKIISLSIIQSGIAFSQYQRNITIETKTL